MDFFGRSYEDRNIVIKSGDRVVWTGRRGDVPKMTRDPVFLHAYQSWKRWHYAGISPEQGTWDEDMVIALEEEFESQYSDTRTLVKMLSNRG